MVSNSFTFWALVVLIGQVSTTVLACRDVLGNKGTIHRYPDGDYDYSAYSECWNIKVPVNKFIQLKIIDLQLYEGCNKYQTLHIEVRGTNESYTFCKIDSTTYPITALTDVQIQLDSPYDTISYNGVPTFKVQFEIQDIECTRKDSFHCSDDSCIPKNEICDGVKDCANGIDEVGCETGIASIKGVSEARFKEITHLKSMRTSSWGWYEHTARAVIALFLAGGAKLDGSNLEEELMAKQTELKTSIALLKSHLPIEQLSMFINSLVVTCHNPRHFYGQNLIKRLREQVDLSGNFTHPIAYLTLCNANETWTQIISKGLLKILSTESDYPFLKDYQAIAVMAVSCFENATKFLNRTENSKLKARYESAIQLFKQAQQSDGSFGNLHTTSLVTQALISSGQEYAKDWNLNATIQYLLQKLAAPHDSLASYMILPVLNAKSLSDVANVNCTSNPRKVGLENFASEIKDYAVPKLRIQYSIFEGDQRDVIHTISIRVPENYTAFDVMVLAEKEDAKFNFKYTKTSGILYVHQIGTVTNDPESGLFWMLYQGLDYTNTTNNLNHLNLSPDQHVMQDKEHLVMWYKKAHI